MKLIQNIAKQVAVIALAGLLASCASTSESRSTGQMIDDTAIQAKVKAALINDPVISGMEIDVDVARGTVHLGGVVNSELERRKALELAQGVEGVKDVHDDMRIRK